LILNIKKPLKGNPSKSKRTQSLRLQKHENINRTKSQDIYLTCCYIFLLNANLGAFRMLFMLDKILKYIKSVVKMILCLFILLFLFTIGYCSIGVYDDSCFNNDTRKYYPEYCLFREARWSFDNKTLGRIYHPMFMDFSYYMQLKLGGKYIRKYKEFTKDWKHLPLNKEEFEAFDSVAHYDDGKGYPLYETEKCTHCLYWMDEKSREHYIYMYMYDPIKNTVIYYCAKD